MNTLTYNQLVGMRSRTETDGSEVELIKICLGHNINMVHMLKKKKSQNVLFLGGHVSKMTFICQTVAFK